MSDANEQTVTMCSSLLTPKQNCSFVC